MRGYLCLNLYFSFTTFWTLRLQRKTIMTSIIFTDTCDFVHIPTTRHPLPDCEWRPLDYMCTLINIKSNFKYFTTSNKSV